MYQPKYLPELSRCAEAMSDMRFGITYTNTFIDRNSSDIDPLHIHGYLEIFFNVSKDVSFFVNDTLYRVSRYDAVVSKVNDVHMCVYNSSDEYEYFCLWIDADFTSPMFSFLKHRNTLPLLSFKEQEGERVIAALNSLWKLYRAESDRVELTLGLYRVLMLMNEIDCEESFKITLPKEMQNIIDDIRENCEYIYSVNDILKNHFVSSSTLSRWFRTYLCTSPHEYLESQKLARALELLLKGASVTEACMKAGFSDSSHFIVRFKRKFGETPMRYVKKFK